MTSQEIFDKVVRHLLQQGKVSIRGSNCAYRGEDDCMCAIGCLIEDDEYNPEMEGGGIDGVLLSLGPEKLLVRLQPYLQLLQALQQAHDDASVGSIDVVPFWEKRFAEIASKFKLKLESS